MKEYAVANACICRKHSLRRTNHIDACFHVMTVRSHETGSGARASPLHSDSHAETMSAVAVVVRSVYLRKMGSNWRCVMFMCMNFVICLCLNPKLRLIWCQLVRISVLCAWWNERNLTFWGCLHYGHSTIAASALNWNTHTHTRFEFGFFSIFLDILHFSARAWPGQRMYRIRCSEHKTQGKWKRMNMEGKKHTHFQSPLTPNYAFLSFVRAFSHRRAAEQKVNLWVSIFCFRCCSSLK